MAAFEDMHTQVDRLDEILSLVSDPKAREAIEGLRKDMHAVLRDVESAAQERARPPRPPTPAPTIDITKIRQDLEYLSSRGERATRTEIADTLTRCIGRLNGESW
jgi:hypothetical protein